MRVENYVMLMLMLMVSCVLLLLLLLLPREAGSKLFNNTDMVSFRRCWRAYRRWDGFLAQITLLKDESRGNWHRRGSDTCQGRD